MKINWNFFTIIILDPPAQEVNEINTVIKPDEKGKTQSSNTNHIYQNIQKK